MGNNNNYRLVYSSDGSHKDICQMCKATPCRCRGPEKIDPSAVTVKIRLEKKGRGGKSVTVLFNLPNNEEYFSSLSKKIKNHCGTGGTFKNGQIEIQGDHKVKVKSFLENLGFNVKLSGG